MLPECTADPVWEPWPAGRGLRQVTALAHPAQHGTTWELSGSTSLKTEEAGPEGAPPAGCPCPGQPASALWLLHCGPQGQPLAGKTASCSPGARAVLSPARTRVHRTHVVFKLCKLFSGMRVRQRPGLPPSPGCPGQHLGEPREVPCGVRPHYSLGTAGEAAVAGNSKPRPGLGARAAVRPLQSPFLGGALGSHQ